MTPDSWTQLSGVFVSRYSVEFKLGIVQVYLNGGIGHRALALKHGITYSKIRYRSAFAGLRHLSPFSVQVPWRRCPIGKLRMQCSKNTSHARVRGKLFQPMAKL